MTRLQLCLLVAALLAGGGSAWWIDQNAKARLLEKEESLRQQNEQLALWSAENQRLTELLARTQKGDALSGAEARELLRLRNRVSLLHASASEAEALRASNQSLETDLSRHLTNVVYWPGSQLTNVGFSDPESAMKTTLWAWIQGDTQAFLSAMTPASSAELARQWEGKTEAELAAQARILSKLYQPAAEGVRVLDQRMSSPEQALLELYFEGDGKRRQFELRRFGEQWCVVGLRAIFN